MKMIVAILQPARFPVVQELLERCGVHGLTVTDAHGAGRQRGRSESYRGLEYAVTLRPKVRPDWTSPERHLRQLFLDGRSLGLGFRIDELLSEDLESFSFPFSGLEALFDQSDQDPVRAHSLGFRHPIHFTCHPVGKRDALADDRPLRLCFPRCRHSGTLHHAAPYCTKCPSGGGPERFSWWAPTAAPRGCRHPGAR